MLSVVCHYCGLPFRTPRVTPGRAHYCCSGCALASRVPVDPSGQFPVNATLVSALVLGFGFFNELLFWLLAVLLQREDRYATADWFVLGSFTLGAFVWIGLVIAQWRANPLRRRDALAIVLTSALMCGALLLESPGWVAVAALALAAWNLRGLARKKPAATTTPLAAGREH